MSTNVRPLVLVRGDAATEKESLFFPFPFGLSALAEVSMIGEATQSTCTLDLRLRRNPEACILPYLRFVFLCNIHPLGYCYLRSQDK